MRMTVKITRISSGAYRAWCPALPGCVVWGASRTEAQEKIEKAVWGYLASLNVALPRELARLVSPA